MTTYYRNTDLEIESLDDLTPIVEAFGEDVVCLFNGRWGARNRAAFEVAGVSSDASSCIRTFHALVEGLHPTARTIWDGCSRRTLDIGFEADHDRQSCQQTIEHDALERSVAMGAHIVVTVYPAR